MRKEKSKVDLCLALDLQSNHYSVTLSPDEAKEFLRRSEVYNRIPRSIESIVDQIDAVTPRAYYNPDNPNNGKQVFDIIIGNEGSRVIYVQVRGLYSLPKKFDWEEYERKLFEVGKKFEADEVDTVEHRLPMNLTVRFWWD